MRLLVVGDPAEAERAGMHGSPPIFIDGDGPFAPPDAPTQLGCRYYPPSVGSDGVPSVEQLERVMSSSSP